MTREAQLERWGSLEEIRNELVVRLRSRLPQVEDGIFGRVHEISASIAPADLEYITGLRDAAREGIDYALTGLERGEAPTQGIPPAASAQARRAARRGTSLETVLRRYHAGDRLLAEFIMGEADDFPCKALQEILRTQSSIVDHLTAAISNEYMREFARMRQSPARQLLERVQELLDGVRDSDPSLNYELDRWHLGLIASGDLAEGAARQLAGKLDCQALLIPAGGGDIWVWLGRRRTFSMPEVDAGLAAIQSGVSVALGEPRCGIAGWRVTHREAQAALQVAIYRPQLRTRCRNVILLAAVMRDQALAASLVETYLAPLSGRGETGENLRETLRAYFKADQNTATAAAALKVDRKTVKRRLRDVEARLGQTLRACNPQLQVALDVEELMPRLSAGGAETFRARSL